MGEIKSVCVYCGASDNVDQVYQDAACDLGKEIADRGLRMIYGAGNTGLMGIISNSVLDNGGHVIGYTPSHLMEREKPNNRIQELYVVDSMHIRKQHMFAASDAFLILPGGFGTLDETFEIITWKQLNLHNKPIILININGYWSHLKQMTDSVFDHKFAGQHQKGYFCYVDSIEEAFATLESCEVGKRAVSDLGWV